MTYHFERLQSQKSKLMETLAENKYCQKENKGTFPRKLWDVLQQEKDPMGFLRWSRDGISVLVNDTKLEKKVMKTYPGLVKIPSFANFRRQMRWYGFDWEYNHDVGLFYFSHPNFQRDKEELLHLVSSKKQRVSKQSFEMETVAAEKSSENIPDGSCESDKTKADVKGQKRYKKYSQVSLIRGSC